MRICRRHGPDDPCHFVSLDEMNYERKPQSERLRFFLFPIHNTNPSHIV